MNTELKILNVGFLSKEDPHDRRPQSGTTFQVFNALKRVEGLNVFWIPFKDTFLSRSYLSCQQVLHKITNIPFPKSRCCSYVKLKEHGIEKKLLDKADVLFCPFTQVVSIRKPFVYMSDALYHQMIGYYWNANINHNVVNSGDKLQQITLDKAKKISMPSVWAAECAIDFYNQPKAKIAISEYGANIDEKNILPHHFVFDGHLHIIFLGIDWIRKGGNIAVDACRWLNDNGIPSTIHIVGPKEIDGNIRNLRFVDFVGFLNKNDKSQYDRLVNLLSICHCLLLPTKAECTGIAFCESSANGLPAFSYITGGVPNYVLDGRNGYLLPLGATGAEFGRKIKDCLLSGEMEHMSVEAVNVYKERLNWDVWANKTAKLLFEASV